jgi:hypothetical protein
MSRDLVVVVCEKEKGSLDVLEQIVARFPQRVIKPPRQRQPRDARTDLASLLEYSAEAVLANEYPQARIESPYRFEETQNALRALERGYDHRDVFEPRRTGLRSVVPTDQAASRLPNER